MYVQKHPDTCCFLDQTSHDHPQNIDKTSSGQFLTEFHDDNWQKKKMV